MRLNGKVSAPIDVISRVPQGNVLEPLLCKLYTCELFHIVGNPIVGNMKGTSIYAIIPRPLSRTQVIDSLN